MLHKGLIVALCLFSVASFISIAVANIFLGISLLLFLFVLYKDRGVCVNADGKQYFRVFGVFGVTLFISAFFSGDILYGLKTWGDFFVWRFMPFIMIMYTYKTDEVAKKLLCAVMCGFAIDCIYAIYQEVFVYGVNVATCRPAGFVGHPMTLAGWICILLPVLLLLVFQKDLCKKIRLGCGALFVIGCIALVFNATRGAWLSLAVVLPLISLPFVLRDRKLFITSVSFVLLVGVILFSSSSFVKRVDSIFDTKDGSNNSRFIIWDASLAMFKEHLVLGVGLGQYKYVYQNVHIKPKVEKQREVIKDLGSFQKFKKNEQDVVLKSPVNLWKIQGFKKLKKQEKEELLNEYKDFRFVYGLSGLSHAHNNFMQMLAENGIVGILGYIFAFGYVLWCNLKNYLFNKNPYALMIVGSTGALMLQGLTEYNFGNSSVMKIYWLVLACLIILASKYDQESC